MRLLISPSLRHVTVLPGNGVREFIKVKVRARRVSYRMLFYSLLFFTFILRFVFLLSTADTIDAETKCSTLGTFSILVYCINFFSVLLVMSFSRFSKCRLLALIDDIVKDLRIMFLQS